MSCWSNTLVTALQNAHFTSGIGPESPIAKGICLLAVTTSTQTAAKQQFSSQFGFCGALACSFTPLQKATRSTADPCIPLWGKSMRPWPPYTHVSGHTYLLVTANKCSAQTSLPANSAKLGNCCSQKAGPLAAPLCAEAALERGAGLDVVRPDYRSCAAPVSSPCSKPGVEVRQVLHAPVHLANHHPCTPGALRQRRTRCYRDAALSGAGWTCL